MGLEMTPFALYPIGVYFIDHPQPTAVDTYA